jgi:oxysterol-binding protein 1
MVGKDLTKVCLPVYFNEPLSVLQKTAEDLEYSELLDQAATYPPRSMERLLKVAAFAVSAYGSTVGRTSKPFNPLLGETFEFVCPEKGFRFIAEKVSHHPTIIAANAEGRSWTYYGDADLKSKFWGRSIELRPEGLLRLTFNDGNGNSDNNNNDNTDEYSWNKVTTSINNLILGKIYIDHGGVMRVRQHATGLTARIRFKEMGMLFDRDPRQVRGYVEQGGKKYESPVIHGHWDHSLEATWDGGDNNNGNNRRVMMLWKKNAPPPDPTRYNLTQFAIQLNELMPGLEKKVAPTDCRLRPDQAALERGEYDRANGEKQRLEHKQRAARRAAERGEPLRPRWFGLREVVEVDGTHEGGVGQEKKKMYVYTGGYWEERERGEFSGCRDIFGA